MTGSAAKVAHTAQTALVTSAHGRHVRIECPDGRALLAHPRGKKLAAVVGDRVRWHPAGDEAVIEAVLPRRNLLMRQDEWRSKSFAANLDQLLIVLAGAPMFSEGQLTRALIAAADAGIGATLLLNKTDLPEAEAARAKLAPYAAMGYAVREASIKRAPEAARAALAPLLAGKATLVLGASGMGKSSLVNLLVPEASAAVAEISTALASGRHTTTHTRWYWLDAARASALLDSPGFQAFGLMHLAPQDLAARMPDLAAHLGDCRFANCSHRHEPGCGVRAAAEAGAVSPVRMGLYAQLWDELQAGQRKG